MRSIPGEVGMSRHLHVQHLRSRNAAEALVAVRDELRGQIRPADRHAPWLYAHHILEADDDFGTGAGLVVQGDAVSWEMIEAIYALALLGADEHHRQAHPDGSRNATQCAMCRKGRLIRRVELAFAIEDRRSDNGPR
jgi:hypothetical protein